ncbi:MAG: pyridoxal 5'-phosphate synthase glutaminase subunit PdxT [Dehalococcoidales bacterium]|nr:pyridoxal 5'-phosphate synthase glutaminase subunit PdxT [Dehalococcoidales bacterium]
MKIGVLAMQGAFAEHIDRLNQLGVETLPVRLVDDLAGLDGLIIPGGESTSIIKLLQDYKLIQEIRDLADNGMAVFGTCAGMILLAKDVTDFNLEPLGIIDISVKRNAFGRQKESFETELLIPILGFQSFPAVFIRAPLIKQVGSNVEIIARLSDNTIVAVQQGKILVSAFHPELTDDLRFHQYFLDIVDGHHKKYQVDN